MSGNNNPSSTMGGAGGGDGKRPDKEKQPEQAGHVNKGKGKKKENGDGNDSQGEASSTSIGSRDLTPGERIAVDFFMSLISEEGRASVNPRYLQTGLDMPKRCHPFPGNVPQYTRVADVRAALQRGGYLDDFVRYQMVIPASELDEYLLSRIALVRDAMVQGAGIEDAIRYLDYTTWDVGAALHQWRTDQYDRAHPPAGTDARETNRALDRSRVLMGDDASTVDSKLKFKVKKEGAWMEFDYKNSHPTFDPRNASDVLKANEARLRFIRENAGLRKPPGKGEWWSELEKRVLGKRYAKTRYQHTGFPDSKGMAQDHNDMLDGARLPGRSSAVPKRTYTQVSAEIDRSHKKHASAKKDRLVGTREMVHTAAQKGIKVVLEEKKQRMLEFARKENWGGSVQDLDDAEQQDPDMYGPEPTELTEEETEEAGRSEQTADGADGVEFQDEEDEDELFYLTEDSEGAVEDPRHAKRRKHDHCGR